MTGAFAEAALDYRHAGLAPVPCGGDNGKHPQIKFKPFGTKLPSETTVSNWAGRFPDSNVGIVTGAASGITLVDIDDLDMLPLMIERCGEPKVMAETPRGGRHLLYRHNGESSPTGLISGVDIKGAGSIWIAPPSKRPDTGRTYSFLRGKLEDLARLRPARAGSLPQGTANDNNRPLATGGTIRQGKRNDTLFRQCLREARCVDDEDALLDVARTINETYIPALPDIEIIRIVHSAWEYHVNGNNWTASSAGGNWARFMETDFDALTPDEMWLFGFLKCRHACRTEPIVMGTALAELIGWTLPRFRKTRDGLEQKCAIKCICRGVKGRKTKPQYILQSQPNPALITGGAVLDSIVERFRTT